MRLRNLRLLLPAWCGLVIAPAVVATVIAMRAGGTEDIGGAVVLTWIVGYLVQFGVFMAISRQTSGTNTIGWFVASMLPWVACWSAPVSLWWLVPCAAVAVGYAFWLYGSEARSDQLQHQGVPASGVVVEVVRPWFNVVINNAYIKRTLRLRVERSDGVPPYEAKYRGTFMFGEIPSVGSTLALRVDPERPNHFEVSDEGSAAPYDDEPVTTPGGDSADQLADQLRELADLHRAGSLTDDEFAAAKRRILGR